MGKQAIVSSKVPPPAGAYSPALAVGELVFVSGQGGFDPATGELVSDEIEGRRSRPFVTSRSCSARRGSRAPTSSPASST